ncbi:hypothetical protein AQUCO_00600219v1 [Aquilegia coerulea]|uniref:Uncharacterized protein n=1 Tax=Aquilegia coerulea TaxID=218851 RepID=A0A2G5ENM0_AQUCA|nr:hypothetical protein AQUCO_00600219v1 [Aquilegia coerulea]
MYLGLTYLLKSTSIHYFLRCLAIPPTPVYFCKMAIWHGFEKLTFGVCLFFSSSSPWIKNSSGYHKCFPK